MLEGNKQGFLSPFYIMGKQNNEPCNCTCLNVCFTKSKWLDNQESFIFLVGNHGYDNTLPEMHPIFLAHGPAFRKNATKEAMNMTDLYPLLCHLLGINPLPNNGSFSNVEDILARPVPRELHPRDYEEESYAYFIGVSLGTILIIVFLVVFMKHLTHSQIPTIHVQHTEIAQPLLQG